MTTDDKRPWPVIVIASLYLLVGVVGFIAHFPELTARHPDAVAIELTELLGAVSGVGLLLRQKWARWLALAWILFHVGLSLFHPIGELAIHAAFCAMIVWALFRAETARWFRASAAA
ncbi:MAG TPA: hypothetical protein VFE01_00135 [Terracidiphilus sp.]|jgi:hypothetical protein|nr:hypothetical protein [Terracidiphilus sp.]